jgi:hypothetical protein
LKEEFLILPWDGVAVVRIRKQPGQAKCRSLAVSQLLLVFEFPDYFSQSSEIGDFRIVQVGVRLWKVRAWLCCCHQVRIAMITLNESDDSHNDRNNFSPLRALDRSQAFVIGSVGGLKRKRKRKLR